jgi:hypothetical protein
MKARLNTAGTAVSTNSGVTSECTLNQIQEGESPLLEFQNEEAPPVSKLMQKVNDCLERFYEQMNLHAQELGMKKSNFASAHGMY